MQYHVLYNPLAGNGNIQDAILALSSFYQKEMISHDITTIHHFKDFFSALSCEDAVILCGGDGTLNHFINAIDATDIPCDILYFALGTGNDFEHDISNSRTKEPISIKEYLKDLPSVTIKGKSYRFLNNVGFGIDGYCCVVGDEMKKTSKKPVNYTAIAIKGLLFHYQPTNATITVDGKKYHYKKVWLAPTMKGRFYGGGMMATPSQNRQDPDGNLSVMLFYGSSRLKTLAVFPSIFKGEHIKHKEMVVVHKGKDIHVEFDRPTPVQIDGETILDVTEYRATAHTFANVLTNK